jgi:hypothetical protein
MEIRNGPDDHDLNALGDSDRQELQPVLDAVSGWAKARGDRSPAFWEQQRAAILSRISADEQHPQSRVSGFAWAVAAAVIVIGSFMLQTGPAPSPEIQRVQTETDGQLLQQVESAMESGGPEALEPAALLAEEIEQHSNANSALTSHKGEVNDEE